MSHQIDGGWLNEWMNEWMNEWINGDSREILGKASPF